MQRPQGSNTLAVVEQLKKAGGAGQRGDERRSSGGAAGWRVPVGQGGQRCQGQGQAAPQVSNTSFGLRFLMQCRAHLYRRARHLPSATASQLRPALGTIGISQRLALPEPDFLSTSYGTLDKQLNLSEIHFFCGRSEDGVLQSMRV